MDKSREFISEHGETLRAALKNSKLTKRIIKQRTDFIRRSLKTTEDRDMFDSIDERIQDIMDSTGKDRFTENEINEIIYQVLNVDLRDYDKSHLINLEKDEITSLSTVTFNEDKTYIFGNTSITPIGRLKYEDWRGVDDLPGLTYYKVERQDAHGRTRTYKVFSNINISQMGSDMDYREAVLYGLLDENNMTKTNCNGYIGNIQTVAEGINLEDTVPINNVYSLGFDSTEANAVAKLAEIAKERKQNKAAKLEEER